MTHNRIPELDVTKGIGIVYMVIGHMHINQGILNRYIYSFHMPLFFIISGMLFKPNPNIIKKRNKTLLVPYIIFGGIYWIIYNSYFIIKTGDFAKLLPTLINLLLFPTNNLVIENALWFLPVMFISTVIYYVISLHIKSIKLLTLVVMLLGSIGFILPQLVSIRFPFGIDIALVAILFFHIGRLIKDYEIIDKIYILRRHFSYYIIGIFIICASVLLIFLNDTINMRLGKWGFAPITIINAVVTSVLYILFTKGTSERLGNIWLFNKVFLWLQHISTISIVYLCINHPIIKLSSILVSKMNLLVPIRIIFEFVICMGLLYLIGELIHKTKLRVLIGKG